jgi:nicotinamidase-related amidase
MRDFYVAVLSDGTASPNQGSHEAALSIMGRIFADLMTTEEVVAVWERALARVSR